MRQQLANLVLATSLGGCSLIYNPSNLPEKQTSIDAAIRDADPSLLRLDEVKSSELLEGAGQDGSSPQILVVFGEHITKQAQVEVLGNSMITTSNLTVADDGNSFAVLVRAPYLDALNEGATVALMVRVSQAGTMQTIPWTLKGLDQITTSPQPAPPAGKLFSRVAVTGNLVFNPGETKAIVKSVGGISVTGTLSANAMGRTPGAGGCLGGAAQSDGSCFGAGKQGGGGAGFVVEGQIGGIQNNTGGPGNVGDDYVLNYGDGSTQPMNRSAGGGGAAGVGGGGGGTVELTAGGNISVAQVHATGAAGGAGGAVGVGGGGGAGGVVVLRAGAMLAFPSMIDVRGGIGGTGTLTGGDASGGRWRYDAVTTSGNLPAVMPASTPAAKRGPIIQRPQNPIFETKEAPITIVGEGGTTVTIITLRPDGLPSESKTEMLLGATTTVTAPSLAIGVNKVCVVVPGGVAINDEATNCIDAAFVP